MYVCMFNFFTPSHGPILKLSTFLESLGHGGPNKIVCSQIDAEIKKVLNENFPLSSYVCPKQMSVPNTFALYKFA